MNKVSEEIIAACRLICGNDYVFTSSEQREAYGHDKTEDLQFLPEMVVIPANTQQVAELMQLFNAHRIIVTPRGGGTGLSGGALPVNGGVILSMERFNRILDIDLQNVQVSVEPGVITEVLQNEVKQFGLFYPPDPSSRGTCFIGGNVAHNSGGPKAVKYGVTRDYVMNLEVVLPTGEVMWTGANVRKNSTGYNLTQLFCGSEGTLGIITKIVLKLRPLPTNDVLMLASFSDLETACRAISAIYLAGFTPSGMEVMDKLSAELTKAYIKELNGTVVEFPQSDAIGAYLLIECDGNNADQLLSDAEKICEVLANFTSFDVLFAEEAEQKEQLWKLRRLISPAVNSVSVTKSDDVVVPRSQLPELVKFVQENAAKDGYRVVCFGHAGDGNLHINFFKDALSEAFWKHDINLSIGRVFEKVVALGGTLSGEHGVGITKRPYIDLVFNSAQLALMQGIKRVFDPNHILNPGKIF